MHHFVTCGLWRPFAVTRASILEKGIIYGAYNGKLPQQQVGFQANNA